MSRSEELKAKQKHNLTATQSAYSARADQYDTKPINGDWHCMLADYFAATAEVKPSHKILSLACGTGLDAYAVAGKLGPEGRILGVDITEEMLEKARQKQQAFRKGKALAPRMDFVNANISDLKSLQEISGGEKWDRILCCSAFVLLQDRVNLLRTWKAMLAEDGMIILDVVQPGTVLPGEILEEIADHFHISLATERLWAKTTDSLRDLFGEAGFGNVDIVTVKYPTPVKTHSVKSQDEIDQFWEASISTEMVENIKTRLDQSQLAEAKQMFEAKWRAFQSEAADKDGTIEEEAKVWVVKASKDQPPVDFGAT